MRNYARRFEDMWAGIKSAQWRILELVLIELTRGERDLKPPGRLTSGKVATIGPWYKSDTYTPGKQWHRFFPITVQLKHYKSKVSCPCRKCEHLVLHVIRPTVCSQITGPHVEVTTRCVSVRLWTNKMYMWIWTRHPRHP